MLRSLIIWIGIGVLITPVCVTLAVLSTGAGHGNYLFFVLFYPYTGLMMSSETELISIIVMFIQFPLYGALISIARLKGSSTIRILVPTGLFVFHVIAMVFFYIIKLYH